MGRIQRCSEVVQARFMRLCCLYWNSECDMSAEDAEIEMGVDEFKEVHRLKIVEVDADGSILIKFLHDQFHDCLELGNKRSLAAKARWEKAKAMQTDASALQVNADKIRLDEIRLDKIRIEESFEQFWDSYDNKKDRKKCLDKWHKLTDGERTVILEHAPRYAAATPDVQFRKHPSTYLNNRTWEDEHLPQAKVNGASTPTFPDINNPDYYK